MPYNVVTIFSGMQENVLIISSIALHDSMSSAKTETQFAKFKEKTKNQTLQDFIINF